MKRLLCLTLALLATPLSIAAAPPPRPNILFIMTDDHAAHAIGAYEGRLAGLNRTPTLDRLAREGMLFTQAFCNNSICTPSRASILTGQYSQANGVLVLDQPLPPAKQHLPREMKKAGCLTWSDGANTRDPWIGEKWDHLLPLDVDGDGDLDLLGNVEEHYYRGPDGKDVSRFSVVWFENPLK